jgi:ribulose-bisphosphate carboxylase small chain
MKLGTFSYLPAMTPQQLRRQVEYIVARGWNAAIEHVEPEQATASYWSMWKLPMFGEKSAERILAEAEACHQAHPGRHVRLVAYDNARQTQGAAMVVYRGTAA